MIDELQFVLEQAEVTILLVQQKGRLSKGLIGAHRREGRCGPVTQQASITSNRPSKSQLGCPAMCPKAPAALHLLQAPQ